MAQSIGYADRGITAGPWEASLSSKAVPSPTPYLGPLLVEAPSHHR